MGCGFASFIPRAPLSPPAAAPDDLDCFPVHKGIGNFLPRLVEVAPEGLSRYAECDRSLFLFESCKVDEPQGLDLLGEEEDNLVRPPTEGAETAKRSSIADHPANPGAAPPAVTAALTGSSLVHLQHSWRRDPRRMKIVSSLRHRSSPPASRPAGTTESRCSAPSLRHRCSGWNAPAPPPARHRAAAGRTGSVKSWHVHLSYYTYE